ncbi:MAG: VTT domain-containing protein [Terriglobia bacterium]
MDELIQFLVRHGYAVLFALVFAEQIGLPLPAIPILLAVGALAGKGELTLGLALAVAVAASLASDLIWYQLGRRRGHRILNLLCRISLEPDSCVRRTENVFDRHGARALLYAKFVPGLNTAAPPMAGLFRMRLPHFLFYDALGALLWAGGFSSLGYLFSDQLERIAAYASQLGGGLTAVIVAVLGVYIGGKYVQRQRFLRQLRIGRITADELRRKLEAGEELVIVDLRHRGEFEAEGVKLPGALHLQPEELGHRHREIPRDRDVILYCT